jgi:hypothetical protein
MPFFVSGLRSKLNIHSGLSMDPTSLKERKCKQAATEIKGNNNAMTSKK